MPQVPDNAALKAEARALLRDARVPPLRFTLLFLAIDLMLAEVSTAAGYLLRGATGMASTPFMFVGVFVSLLDTVLLAGYARYCLGVQRGLEMPYQTLFDAFSYAGRVILLTVLQGLLIALGFVLFFVPGVILAFAYAFALYYLCEDPDAGVVEALRRSRLSIKGYKWRLFTLLLSFLPLQLLFALPVSFCEYVLRGVFPATLAGTLLDTLASGLLAACASLYLIPYMALAQVCFFRYATQQQPYDETEF